MRGEAGFSLIEVLVALAIMATATGVVVLTMGGGGSLSAETDRFIASIATARDRALVENRTVAMEVSETGYSATVRSRLGPVRSADIAGTWEQGTSIATPDNRLPVVLMFDSLGLTEPAQFILFRGRERDAIAIDPSGAIRRLDDAP